jgi:hypothetical protein
VSGLLLGLVVAGFVAGTGTMIGSTLGLRSATELGLAAYVIGFAAIVALCLFLSVLDEMTKMAFVAGSAALLAAAVGLRLLVGGASLPTVPLGTLRSLARSRPVLVLSIVVAAAASYVLMLIVATPPNGWDQLNYHLARAALWLEFGIAYIDSAYDQRLNIYPPNGEIPFSFILGVTQDENLAALVQLVAALACAVGVFALARRFGLNRPEACFGALLFLALPIVLLQSSTTKNDLVVASLLVCASVFVLGDSRRAIGIASLASALAMGSKFTAGYGLLVLLALAVTARPRTLLVWRVGGLVVGAVLGSYWYAINALEGGGFLGDRSNIPGLTAFLKPPENVVSIVGLVMDWLDLSGAQGEDILLYLVAAATVVVGVALAGRRSGNPWRRSALLAAALVASPLALWVLSTEVGRPALVSLHDALGEPDAFLAEGAVAASPATASDTGSWFGPAGLLLVVGAGAVAVVLGRRRLLESTALVAAAAPFVWLVLISLTLTYHPWQGRFFVYPVALSASLWGLALRAAPLAWSAVALAATTVLLSLVHYAEKPSGIRLLDRSPTASVWRMERWQVQSLHDPALAPVFRFLDEEIPPGDSIALALGANDFGYPAFGAHLERRVALVPFGSTARDLGTDWLLANPERASEIDSSCWLKVFRSESGTIFRRQTCSG